MKSINNRKKRGTLGAGLTLLTLAGIPANAQKAVNVVEGVHAIGGQDATTVDIALTGATTPTVHAEGNRLVVTLPHVTPSPSVWSHLISAGLISGIAVEETGVGKSARVILVLRSPAQGEFVSGPDVRTIRLIVAPEGRLSRQPAPKVAPRVALKPRVRRPKIAVKPLPVAKMASRPFAQTRCAPVPHLVAFTPHIVAAAFAAPAAPEPPVVPAQTRVLTPAVAVPSVKLYNINAYQSDLAGVLNSLAQDSHVSMVMAGPVTGKVTMTLRQVPLEKAVDLLTKAAGLSYHRDGDVFVVGDTKGLEAAYPVAGPTTTQTIYRCLHVSATDIVTALQNMFDKDKLRVSVGAAPSSPHLDDASTSDVTGVTASTVKGTGGGATGPTSHIIVLAGQSDIVAQALDLAQKLDVRRSQVKIGVQITDIDRSALKNLGLQWSFGSIGITENQPSGIGFGSFTRSPFSVTATLTALENRGNAKLLAAPNMSILDGEQGFILIGDRIQYPKLTGYTQAQTPIYDVTEERVGIYLQVAVQMEDNGEITLTIYPQVSTVSGYLNVNGASYPQISTREQQTTIRVKDGQQIVVGGLIRDEEINNVQKVPILSQIPFFKELFTYHNTTHQQSEVVIVITPQILKD